MEKRKNPEKDLRKQSGLFFQVGLLAALMLAVSAFEYRTEAVKPTVYEFDSEGVEDPIIPITVHDVPPPPPRRKPVIVNPVESEPDVEPPMDMEPIVDLEDLDDHEIFVDEGPKEEKVDDAPFLIVEEMPSPEGGVQTLYKYINKKLKYPHMARRNGIEGTVYLGFVVDENGNMTDLHIVKGIGAGCDEEVLRIFEKSFKWNPGKQRGVPVKVRQQIPIKFVLN